jgi:hypothetical protein
MDRRRHRDTAILHHAVAPFSSCLLYHHRGCLRRANEPGCDTLFNGSDARTTATRYVLLTSRSARERPCCASDVLQADYWVLPGPCRHGAHGLARLFRRQLRESSRGRHAALRGSQRLAVPQSSVAAARRLPPAAAPGSSSHPAAISRAHGARAPRGMRTRRLALVVCLAGSLPGVAASAAARRLRRRCRRAPDGVLRARAPAAGGVASVCRGANARAFAPTQRRGVGRILPHVSR